MPSGKNDTVQMKRSQSGESDNDCNGCGIERQTQLQSAFFHAKSQYQLGSASEP